MTSSLYGTTGNDGNADADTERAALLTTNGDSSNPKKKVQDNNARYWVGVSLALLLTAALVGNLTYNIAHANGEREQPAATLLETPSSSNTSSVHYRPLCQVYTSQYQVITAVQTSMKDPSHPWTNIPCLDASTIETTALPTILDTYQVPDARFQVNLRQPAFVGRPPILGFGGAFTEASARNFHSLSADGQQAVIELLFGKDGLGYALGRIHMNSCDFSVESYAFDDTDGDFTLEKFDTQVTHDVETGMVDFAKRAVSKLRQDWTTPGSDVTAIDITQDGNLRLYASPWSPPSWMKRPTWQDKKDATHAARMTFSTQPSCLREGTGADSKYAAAWALYFSKYLSAYAAQGLPFWGVTVQNEPEFPAPWEACAYTPKAEEEFVAHHLGPQLRQDHPEVKLFIFDHNKDHINKWTKLLLNATHPAAQYVDGTAYHWYAGGMDRLLDGALGSANMHRLQDQLVHQNLHNSHLVLGSESCHCPSTGYSGGDINVYWARAERYVHTILADLAAGSNAWVEWNLILDSIGGPNHLGNLCDATILAVPHRAINATPDIPPLMPFEVHLPMGNVSIGDGRTREELNALGFPAKYLDKGVAVQPIYHYMGHVSRHVRPGSRAVTALVTSGNKTEAGRIFRAADSVVAGGGQNDLARNGIEVTLWPCEGSTRQRFSWKNERARGNPLVVHGHDWLGQPTTSCVGNTEDVDVLGLRLVDCDNAKETGLYDVVPAPYDPLGRVRIFLDNGKGSRKDRCLVVRHLLNNGGAYGPRGGAQVTIGDCTNGNSLWKYDEALDEISSYEFASVNPATERIREDETVCMTTGWPFLQMGAFVAANEAKKTVVVLNEANDPANFALVDNGELIMTGSIPARSTQTYQLQEQPPE